MMNDVTENFRKNYKSGDILNVYWGKGNGKLRRICMYCGINPYDDAPILMDAQKLWREHQAVFFDAPNDINPEETTCEVRYSPFHNKKYSTPQS